MLSRGASGLKQAMRFAIGWPPKAKIDAYSAPDMEKIRAFREKECATSALPLPILDCKDVEPSYHGCSFRSGGSSHSAFRDLGKQSSDLRISIQPYFFGYTTRFRSQSSLPNQAILPQ